QLRWVIAGDRADDPRSPPCLVMDDDTTGGEMTLTRAFFGAAALSAALLAATSAGATRTRRAPPTTCSPTVTILEAPRAQAVEVQAKAINNRGDVVGFSDSNGG